MSRYWVAVAVVVVGALLVPLTGLIADSEERAAATILGIGLLAVCALFAGIVPWLSAGWHRRTAKRIFSESPDSVVFIATVANNSKSTGIRVVAEVSDGGLTVFARDKEPMRVGWGADASIELEYVDGVLRPFVRITAESESSLLLAPLATSGSRPLAAKELQELVNKVRGLLPQGPRDLSAR